MLKKVGAKDVVVSSNWQDIEHASKIILPGVGAFDNAMKKLEDLHIIPILRKKALVDQVPFLGICLGMQIMSRRSEEGIMPGLGLIEADTVKFRACAVDNFKIPHMGWNIAEVKKSNALISEQRGENRFYFVHSYHVICDHKDDILTETIYGQPFTSAFQRENIWGMQFHPEKSHRFGMDVFKNFLELK